MPLLLIVGVFAVLVRLASMPLDNFDTYFHLRFGHEFLTNWSLRHPGSVSTFATADWVPTQWLPEVVMAWSEDHFGLAAVAWLSGVQMCSVALTYFWVARRWADPLATAPVVILAVVACAPGLSMRPQVLSYILIAITAAAWFRVFVTGKVPWHLLPLTWLWAMCHGMWTVGILIGVAAVAGIALDHQVTRRQLLRLSMVPLLSLIAAGVTPVGPGLYRAVLTVNSRGHYFSEWDPASFTSPNCIALIVLIATVLTVLLKGERARWTDVFMVLLAGGWALYSSRTVPVAAAMIVPLAARSLQTLIGERTRVTRSEIVAVIGSFAASLAVLAAIVPTTAEQPPHQPNWVDPALSALPPGTPVLNEWGWGGYLMWRFPNLDLMMHGYGDTFTTPELDRNVDILELQPGWDELVRESGARYAVLDPESPLAYALVHTEGWHVLNHSPEVQLLEAPTRPMSE